MPRTRRIKYAAEAYESLEDFMGRLVDITNHPDCDYLRTGTLGRYRYMVFYGAWHNIMFKSLEDAKEFWEEKIAPLKEKEAVAAQ